MKDFIKGSINLSTNLGKIHVNRLIDNCTGEIWFRINDLNDLINFSTNSKEKYNLYRKSHFIRQFYIERKKVRYMHQFLLLQICNEIDDYKLHKSIVRLSVPNKPEYKALHVCDCLNEMFTICNNDNGKNKKFLQYYDSLQQDFLHEIEKNSDKLSNIEKVKLLNNFVKVRESRRVIKNKILLKNLYNDFLLTNYTNISQVNKKILEITDRINKVIVTKTYNKKTDEQILDEDYLFNEKEIIKLKELKESHDQNEQQ